MHVEHINISSGSVADFIYDMQVYYTVFPVIFKTCTWQSPWKDIQEVQMLYDPLILHSTHLPGGKCHWVQVDLYSSEIFLPVWRT